MTRRILAAAFAIAALLAAAQPAAGYVINSASGTVSIGDGTSNVLLSGRVRAGNMPS